jgi:hypothetical protein
MSPDEYSDLSNRELLRACTLGISMQRSHDLLLCLTLLHLIYSRDIHYTVKHLNNDMSTKLTDNSLTQPVRDLSGDIKFVGH